MGSNITGAINEVTVALREVVRRQMPYDRLGVAWETFRERYLLAKGHLENLIRVFVHERWPTHDQLVHEDAQCVPVRGSAMAHIEDDLGWDILRRPTESIGTIPSLQALAKAEVR